MAGDYFRATWIPAHDSMGGAEQWPGETFINGTLGAVEISAAIMSLNTWRPAETIANWGALANCEVAAVSTTSPTFIDPPLPPVWPYPTGLIYGREYFSVLQHMIRGDTYSFNASIKLNGSPFNLTGCEVNFSAKWEYTDLDASAVISLGIGTGVTVTDAANGEINVKIPASATVSLPAHEVQLYYDIQVVDAAANVYTTLRGTLIVSPDVTVATA